MLQDTRMPIDALRRLNGGLVWLIRGATEPEGLHVGRIIPDWVPMADGYNEFLEPKRPQ